MTDKAVSLPELAQSLLVSGIKLNEVKSRKDLTDKLEAIKTLVAKNKNVDIEILQHIKFLWKPTNLRNSTQSEVGLGVPGSLDELEEWVRTGRLKDLVQDQTLEAYLEFITNGQYTIENKDWKEYRTGSPSMTVNPATGDAVKDMPTDNSSFFFKRVGSSGVAPFEAWRTTAARSRETLGQLLKDPHIKYQFECGDFLDWEDLENKLLEYRALDDHKDEYPRLIILRNQVKELIRSPDNVKMNMGTLLSSCRPYLCDVITRANKDIKNNLWKSQNTTFPGPETGFQPVFYLLGVILGTLNMSDKDFIAAEEEWLKTSKSMNPLNLAENRPELLDCLTRQGKSKSGYLKINEIAETTPEDLREASEDYLAEKLSATIADEREFERICAIQETRFRRIGFKKRGGKLNRFQRFAAPNGANQRGGARGGFRGRGRGQGRGRGGQQGQGRNNNGRQNKICFDCHNNSGNLHYERNCPRKVRAVVENDTADQYNHNLMEDQADQIRQVLDTGYNDGGDF